MQYFLPHYFIDKEYGKARGMLNFVMRSQIVSSLVIIAIMLFVAPWLATHYFHSPLALPLLQTFCIYFLIINIFQMIQSVFIATQKVKRSQWVEWVRMWSIVLFVIVARQLNVLDLNTFMRTWLGGLIVACTLGYIAMRKQFDRLYEHKPVYDKALRSKWLWYAIWVIIGTNATMLLSQVDQQFALFFFGPESAGYRTNYLTLFNIVLLICAPIVWYMFPLLNELHKKNEKEKIRLLNRLLYTGIMAIGAWVGVIAYFRWTDLAVLLFGEKFRQSGELFEKWAWFLWLAPLMSIQFQNLASRGMVQQRVGILLIGLAINIIANLILMKTVWLIGLIYGTALGLATIITLSFIIQKRRSQ